MVDVVVSVVDPNGRGQSGLLCKEKTRTQQHLASECDINQIVKKFEQTGVIERVNKNPAQFGDFTNVPDFQSALDMVHQAESSFMELPAFIRERFDNDPGELLAFLGDRNNDAEAIKLGLIDEPKGGPAKAGSEPGQSGPEGTPGPVKA